MSCLSVPVAEDGQPEHGRGSYVYGYGFDELVASMPSMAGKTIAVTGSTSGTGYVLAREAANKGARVLLLNRPSPRADAAEVRLTPTPKSAPPGSVFKPDHGLHRLGLKSDAGSFHVYRFGQTIPGTWRCNSSSPLW